MIFEAIKSSQLILAGILKNLEKYTRVLDEEHYINIEKEKLE